MADRENPYDMTEAPTLEECYKPTARNVRGLGRALWLSVTPHELNSSFRKRLTLIMFVVWGAMAILRAAGFAAVEAVIFWPLTVCVFSIFFHMWGFEYGAIAAAGRVDPDDDFAEELPAETRETNDHRNR